MRILLIESDPGQLPGLEAQLLAAGHEISRCHRPGQPSFPCLAVSGGACPLDETTDVVLDRRTHIGEVPTTWEQGVSCALREDIPVVVADASGANPFAPWTVAALGPGDDLLETLEIAAATAPPAVVAAARAEARRLLGEEADVRITRDGGRLALQLVAPGMTDRRQLSSAAVRVLDAARSVAHGVNTMDIGLAADADSAAGMEGTVTNGG